MIIALIGKGPSWDAYRFCPNVSLAVVNSFRPVLSAGSGYCWCCTIREHVDDLFALSPSGSLFPITVLIDKDDRGVPVKGHTSPRVLRWLCSTPETTRIYLQGFDLDRPEYLPHIREFAKIARSEPDKERVIVTTPGPLAKFFTCRAPDPEHLGVAR
jgi:hypothetical protein